MSDDVKKLIAEGHERAKQWEGYNPHSTILKFIVALESAVTRAEAAEDAVRAIERAYWKAEDAGAMGDECTLIEGSCPVCDLGQEIANSVTRL